MPTSGCRFQLASYYKDKQGVSLEEDMLHVEVWAILVSHPLGHAGSTVLNTQLSSEASSHGVPHQSKEHTDVSQKQFVLQEAHLYYSLVNIEKKQKNGISDKADLL